MNSEDFTFLTKVGKGSFGEVWKAVNKKTQQVVAIKNIDLEEADDDIEDIRKEISILSELESDFVTRYYGSFIEGTRLSIVMEYLGGGSVFDLMQSCDFDEAYIAIVMREVLKGLEYLHSTNKIHRDIKAANILLSDDGSVKLADFGVSGQITDTMSKRNTFIGTPFWMAPEIITQTGHDTSADIWSLGICALEMAEGAPPLSELHPMKALMIIPKANVDPPKLQDEKRWSRAFHDFVGQCLVKDPTRRASPTKLLQHKFIKSAKKAGALMELLEERQAAPTKKHDGPEDTNKEEGPSVAWDFGTVDSAPAEEEDDDYDQFATIAHRPSAPLPAPPVADMELDGMGTVAHRPPVPPLPATPGTRSAPPPIPPRPDPTIVAPAMIPGSPLHGVWGAAAREHGVEAALAPLSTLTTPALQALTVSILKGLVGLPAPDRVAIVPDEAEIDRAMRSAIGEAGERVADGAVVSAINSYLAVRLGK